MKIRIADENWIGDEKGQIENMDEVQTLIDNLKQPDFMAKGSPDQKAVFDELQSSGVLKTLTAFDPILTGSFPLDIHTADSDLDIVCYAPDLEIFSVHLQKNFGLEIGYTEKIQLKKT